MNTFGVGEWPLLLSDVNCTETHSRLSECVHPEEIGLYRCLYGSATRAGVSCETAVTSSPVTDVTTTSSSSSVLPTESTTVGIHQQRYRCHNAATCLPFAG